MLHTEKFKNPAVLALIMAGLAMALTGISVDTASAKKYKVKFVVKATQSGTGTIKLKGTYTSKVFGKGKVTGTLVIPETTVTLKLKGGTATLRGKGVITGSKVNTKWKWIKGTGKYKKIKGSGTSKGLGTGGLSESDPYSYTGTATY